MEIFDITKYAFPIKRFYRYLIPWNRERTPQINTKHPTVHTNSIYQNTILLPNFHTLLLILLFQPQDKHHHKQYQWYIQIFYRNLTHNMYCNEIQLNGFTYIIFLCLTFFPWFSYKKRRYTSYSFLFFCKEQGGCCKRYIFICIWRLYYSQYF